MTISGTFSYKAYNKAKKVFKGVKIWYIVVAPGFQVTINDVKKKKREKKKKKKRTCRGQ